MGVREEKVVPDDLSIKIAVSNCQTTQRAEETLLR